MAYVAGHLSVAALEERYEACEDVTSSRHFQTIWLLAKGHSTRRGGGDDLVWPALDRAACRALQRVWTFGAGRSASGQRRVGEGSDARTLGASCAYVWPNRRPTAGFGRAARSRAGWRANWGWPRSRRNAAGRRCRRSAGRSRSRGRAIPKAATLEEQEAFKKNSPKSSPRKRRAIPTRRSRPSRPTSTGSA